MTLSPLTALSPLDGRYAAKVAAAAPAAVRVRPDAPARAGRGRVVHRAVRRRLRRVRAAVARPRAACCAGWCCASAEADAQAIKDIERTTNHDVKAVEYWLKRRFEAIGRAAGGRRVRALRLHQRGHQQHQPRADAAAPRATEVLLPALDRLIAAPARDGARAGRRADAGAHPRPDREPDHGGQGSRQRRARGWRTARARIAAVPLLAKMNGAVGNYNAHLAA